ncbi:MAG: transcriptional regulator [Chlamydiales bacterium]|jgi:transcriptional regulator with XRE-family HTH domain|nr:transcriptional regulator [Chlamydiales bacterium]
MKEFSCIEAFAEQLTKLRKGKGWSQPELGEKIGTSGQVISRYERGKIHPSIDVVYRMAKLFQVSVDFLLGKEGAASSTPQDARMLNRWKALEQLPEPEKEHFLFVFDAFIRDAAMRQAYQSLPREEPK